MAGLKGSLRRRRSIMLLEIWKFGWLLYGSFPPSLDSCEEIDINCFQGILSI